jgi:hypothetical protein
MTDEPPGEVAKDKAAPHQGAAAIPPVAVTGGNAGRQQNPDTTQRKPKRKKHDCFDWVGLIVLAVTCAAAGIAAFYAGDLAFISQDAANDAHTSFTATQRPFITVKELKAELIDGQKAGGDGQPPSPQQYWIFTPIFENSGNTLTKNLRVYPLAYFKRQPLGLSIEQQQITQIDRGKNLDFPHDPEEISKSGSVTTRNFVIGPHSNTRIGGVGITPDDLKPGSPTFFIYGILTYDDTFSKTLSHKTKYCFEVGPIPVLEKTPDPSICIHWNCTDDECESDKKDYEADVGKGAIHK